MKKAFIIFTLIQFCFLSTPLFGQDKQESDNSETKKTSKIFNYKPSTSNHLILNQVGSTNMNALNDNQSLTVIRQIGDGNIASSRSNATISEFNYLQLGNNNSISSSNSIRNSQESVIQNGNNNKFTNFSFGNVENSFLNLILSSDIPGK